MSHSYNTRHKRRNRQPHPSYYVGYCEDDETVESIMKKFAVVDKKIEEKKQKALAQEKQKQKENTNPNKSKKKKKKNKKTNKNKNKNKNNDNDNDNQEKKKSSKAEISDSDREDNDNDNDESESEEEEDIDIEVNENKNENENNNGMEFTEDDYQEIFIQTSMFSMGSLKNNNEISYDRPIIDEDGFVLGYETNIHNSELIIAADYEGINNDLKKEGDFDDPEYNPDKHSDSSDSDFFEDVLNVNKNKRNKKGSKRLIGGIRSRGGRKKSGVVNAPKSDPYLENIDKHYAYTYGRRLAPLVEGDAQRRARALRLRTCKCLYTLKLPKHPMPRSWGHRVKRFNGHRDLYGRNVEKAKKELMAFDYIEHDNLLNLKANELPHGQFHAVLIDIPWDTSDALFSPRKGMIKYEQLTDLPIGDIVENGMLFVWVPSDILVYVTHMIEVKWGFIVVEHASWGRKDVRNRFKIRKGGLINYTKENLLIFRKGEYKKERKNKKFVDRIELRHQRTSDTHINFARYHKKFTKMEIKPREFTYRMIETMLPDATQEIRDAYNNKTDLSKVKSRLLYLWAPQYEIRGGWTIMVDKKHLEYLQNIQDDPNYDDGMYPHKRCY